MILVKIFLVVLLFFRNKTNSNCSYEFRSSGSRYQEKKLLTRKLNTLYYVLYSGKINIVLLIQELRTFILQYLTAHTESMGEMLARTFLYFWRLRIIFYAQKVWLPLILYFVIAFITFRRARIAPSLVLFLSLNSLFTTIIPCKICSQESLR